MKTTILLISLFCAGFSSSQDSANVLFIGNSYTYVNDLPMMVSQLATSLNDVVTYDSQTIGGATFNTHAGNATTYTKINSQPWDFVVMQAQSQEPSFPDAQVDVETLPYAMQMSDSVYANNFCTDVMMFMTWGRKNGDPQWGPISTFDGMNQRLRNAYLRMADSVQGSVSPVGVVWKYMRDNYPLVDLYQADESHPSAYGSYVAACTFYASIFRKSPAGAAYVAGLDPVICGNIQDAAALVVLDSLTQWNLRPISEHTQADFSFNVIDPDVDFTNQSTKATNYYWDFGDMNTSTAEHPSHTYTSNGTYDVTLIAESPCDTDTLMYQVTINSASLVDLDVSELKYAYTGNGVFQFDAVYESISVYTIAGQLIGTFTQTNALELTNYEYGVYLVVAEKDGVLSSQRLPYLAD